jgi:putative membrane protein insertion efficiency factor
MKIFGHICSLLLLTYRKVLSPLLPPACRFYPPCSVFAQQAIAKHGILKGLARGLWRVARCHPGSRGGYDPVV